MADTVPTVFSMIMVQLLLVYGRYIVLIWGGKWEGSVNCSCLNVKNMGFTRITPHNDVASTDLNFNQKSGENLWSVLIIITS